jgi:hypothetical protein
MSFCYEPKKGERLPKLRTSINPFCHKIEDINHIPGQVITLVLASNKNWMNDYMIDIFNCC